MAFKLPDLTYSYESLEPHIDARTMEIHHQNHHGTYVKNLNAAIEGHRDLEGKDIEEILMNLKQVPEQIRTAVQNNGGGHYNHTLFWSILHPGKGGEPKGRIAEAIHRHFQNPTEFKASFKKAALGRFGSGWVWLVTDPKHNLSIVTTPNQDSPLLEKNRRILMGLDVWEHAYYLKYQFRRADYVDAWWNVVNWEEVGKRYEWFMEHAGETEEMIRRLRAA
jgi:Fe-Mn family superoxide dismutase